MWLAFPERAKKIVFSALLVNPQELSGQGIKIRRCRQEIAALCFTVTVSHKPCRSPRTAPQQGGWADVTAAVCINLRGVPRG